MLDFKIVTAPSGEKLVETSIKGKALLTIAQLNKGTAFTSEERHAFKLLGKLPYRVETLKEQVERVYLQLKSYKKPINRNIYLNTLLNTNQTVFYALIKKHIEELLPTIYTPIVGNVVETYNQKFFQPRGLYISYEEQDHIEEILENRSNPEIDIIVVSDGEGVLGIGDQGVGGMAIPIAKLMVYTALGGINPNNTLPILLDAGTNNTELLNDPLYLGWRHPRVSGKEYDIFIDKFIKAVQKKIPHAFLHWEDFGRFNAHRNLAVYREKICSFNDDIQGTGVVAISAILSALNIVKSTLPEQRIVIFGAGTAGIGVADQIARALCRMNLSMDEARQRIYLVDRFGLVTEYCDEKTEAQLPYLRPNAEIDRWKVKNKNRIELLEVIQNLKPTILIGSSAQSGAFNQEIVTEMLKYQERPIIFPLSNPNTRCEATPSDLIKWTDGKVLVATGSPFEPVQYKNKEYVISQCNNYLAFPGIGLGVIAVKARSVTDNMLWAASQALSQYSTTDNNKLLPTIQEAEEASRLIAIVVAKTALEEGLADAYPFTSIEDLVDQNIWQPQYFPYRAI